MRRFLAGVGLAAALAAGFASVPRVSAATTERIISDVRTGLAISGIDPLSYFVDAAPRYGVADHELSLGGVIWRFRNEGNKAAFAAHPDVYMPRYGGYDPIAIGRGVAVPGNPLLWVMAGERIYLFYDEKSRDRFIANPGEAMLIADNKWSSVVSSLVP